MDFMVISEPGQACGNSPDSPKLDAQPAKEQVIAILEDRGVEFSVSQPSEVN